MIDATNDKAAAVRVAYQAYLAPKSETIARCRTDRVGLSHIRPPPKRKNGSVIVANGVIDTVDGFVHVRVANFTTRAKSVPIGMVLAIASSVEYITEVDDEATAPTVAEWMRGRTLDHLTTHEQDKVRDLLRQYSVLFDGTDLGPITGMSQSIETQDATPTHQPPYRAGPYERKLIGEVIERMLRLHGIQPSVSAWASPVVLGQKTDGSTCFCIDYRKLNDLTVRDSLPLPRRTPHWTLLARQRLSPH
jgi:hypothetical protein